MKILVIGAGTLGSSIAKCLARKGHELLVFNRTHERAERLCSTIGCKVIGGPDGARDAEAAVVSLFDDVANFEVLIAGRFLESLSGRVVLNTSTISPEASLAISRASSERGVKYYECTVYGSVDEAEACGLVSMIAGQEPLDEAEKIAREFSSSVHRIGPIPSATVLKLALNNVGLSIPALVGESLMLLEGYGVPLEKFEEVASRLWFGEFVRRYIERSRSGKRRFTVRGAAKDYGLISGALRSVGRNAVISSALASFYAGLIEDVGDEDYSAAIRGYLRALRR